MRCWSESVPNLQDHGWHTAIESIEVFDHNVCPAPAPTTIQGSGSVKFYAKANFEKELHNLPTGTHPLEQGPYYSIKIPSGWSVRLYDADGRNRCFNQEVRNLQDHEEWWRLTTRVDVMDYDGCETSTGEIELYHIANYEDLFDELNVDTKHYFPKNNLLFSMRVPSGMSAVFHAPDGRTRCWNSNVANMQDHEEWWRETIQIDVYSFDICPKPTPPSPTCEELSTDGIVLYDDQNCWGDGLSSPEPASIHWLMILTTNLRLSWLALIGLYSLQTS